MVFLVVDGFSCDPVVFLEGAVAIENYILRNLAWKVSALWKLSALQKLEVGVSALSYILILYRHK